MTDSAAILQGTLELLILKSLDLEPMHGWGIGNRIAQMSGDALQVTQGSLYPAFQRMLRKGLIKSEWRASDNNRRARYYRLTAAGRKQLVAETANWRRAAAGIEGVLAFGLADRS